MQQDVEPAAAQPNGWYHRQLWREPFPSDEAWATQLRQALVDLRLHPRRDLAQNPNLATMEANHRAALPEILAELDRTDLAIVLQIARLLAVVPRDPGLLR